MMVRVRLRDDTIYEVDEMFRGRLTVEAGSMGVRIGGADTATATIVDDDGKSFQETTVEPPSKDTLGPTIVSIAERLFSSRMFQTELL